MVNRNVLWRREGAQTGGRALATVASIVLALFVAGCSTAPAPAPDSGSAGNPPAVQSEPAADTPVPAPDSPERVTIRLNLSEGESYELSSHVRQTVDQEFLGQSLTIRQDLTGVTRYTVRSVDGDGVMDLDVTYESFDMSMSLESTDVSKEQLDQLNQVMNGALQQSARLVNGVTFSMRVSPAGDIVSIQGVEQLMARVLKSVSGPGDTQQVRDALQQVLSGDAIRRSWEESFGYITDGPVAVGDEWTSDTSVNMGLSMDVHTRFALESVDGDTLVLNVDGTIASSGFDGAILDQLNAEGVDFDLSIEGTQSGTMRVDRATGWLVGQESVIDATADILISAEGQELRLPITMHTESTVR